MLNFVVATTMILLAENDDVLAVTKRQIKTNKHHNEKLHTAEEPTTDRSRLCLKQAPIIIFM